MNTNSEATPVKPTPESFLVKLLQVLPALLAAIIGIVYAAGYLIEFSYINSLGIRGAGAESFKAKYIYVGLLCLQFPVSAMIIVLCFFGIARQMKLQQQPEKLDKVKAYTPSILLLLNLFFSFYILILFSRAGLFHEHFKLITLLFIIVLVGLVIARGAEVKVRSHLNKKPKVAKLLRIIGINNGHWDFVWSSVRWLIFLTSVGLTIYIFRSIWGLIYEMLYEGGFFHYTFILLIGLMLWRFERRGKDYAELGLCKPFFTIGICITITLMYLSVLLFAYRVYPFIPLSRGGGDFTNEKPVVLTFERKYVDAIPDDLHKGNINAIKSDPVYILYEDSSSFYVTKDMDTSSWRKSGPENKPKGIISIKKDSIVSVDYTP